MFKILRLLKNCDTLFEGDSMLASERLKQIVQITNEKGFVSTEELANRFQVTETTIRRDSLELEGQGLIVRVHGGMKSLNQKLILSKSDETKMSERQKIHAIEKDKVCQKASTFVQDGDCIFVDGGSSTVDILKYIKGKQVKIVTHSQLIIRDFDDDKIELFVIGGKYLPEYSMNVGPITLNEIARFNFDHAFISCAGIDIEKHLVYTAEMDTMAIKQKAMSQAVHSYLLIDDSKFDVKGFCSFISSDEFDVVICNETDRNFEDIPNNFIFV